MQCVKVLVTHKGGEERFGRKSKAFPATAVRVLCVCVYKNFKSCPQSPLLRPSSDRRCCEEYPIPPAHLHFYYYGRKQRISANCSFFSSNIFFFPSGKPRGTWEGKREKKFRSFSLPPKKNVRFQFVREKKVQFSKRETKSNFLFSPYLRNSVSFDYFFSFSHTWFRQKAM